MTILTKIVWPFNTLRPRQNYRHFPDDIFKYIFFNQSVWMSIEISLKFVPKCQINNIPALVQIMAWRRPGDKPLSEPMMVHWRICASLGLNELRLLVVLVMCDRFDQRVVAICVVPVLVDTSCVAVLGHGLFWVWPFWQGSPVKNQMLHKGQGPTLLTLKAF